MSRTRLRNAQTEHHVRLTGQSTGSTPVVLTTDGGAPTASNQLAITADSVIRFSGRVLGYETGGNRVVEYEVEGWLKRPAAEAGTVLLNDIVFDGYENVATMSLDLTADTTNGAVTLTFTGSSSYVVNLEADLEWQEVQ